MSEAIGLHNIIIKLKDKDGDVNQYAINVIFEKLYQKMKNLNVT